MIPKEIQKQIKAIAKKLPQLTHRKETEKRTIHGSRLIEMGRLEVDGKKVKDNKFYIGTFPKIVDHKKELEKIYLKDGTKGIVEYQVGCYRLASPPTN